LAGFDINIFLQVLNSPVWTWERARIRKTMDSTETKEWPKNRRSWTEVGWGWGIYHSDELWEQNC